MTVNPVFINELRQSAFRRRPVLIGATWIGIAFLLLLPAFAHMGKLPLVILPSILLPLIVPSIAAGAFAKEYEQQTWQDLYLTRLTNAQVVIGKFCAYFLQVGAMLLAFAPALLLMLINDLVFDTISLGVWMQILWSTGAFIFKLFLSAILYILLAMVCSRYSSTRRTALAWSYAALGLYAAAGWLVWNCVGQLSYQNDVLTNALANGPNASIPTDPLTIPGFMEGFHLIFCSVVGLGSMFLLWVSLSEQRGYKQGQKGEEQNRAWQPIAARRLERVES